jgi:hypothetical protein
MPTIRIGSMTASISSADAPIDAELAALALEGFSRPTDLQADR